ncbi:MAG TPA: tetratricopeptide repeat protein, partial [Anaerolineaceae bacterium]|nr:tetratricopeptide repeat protein [Anaerolineaceae bacterium]
AFTVYQQAMKIAPNDHRSYYQAGLALREIKDYSGAETLLRKAAQLAPRDLVIRRQLAAIIALNMVTSVQEANICR